VLCTVPCPQMNGHFIGCGIMCGAVIYVATAFCTITATIFMQLALHVVVGGVQSMQDGN